jgi:hypothetical protein
MNRIRQSRVSTLSVVALYTFLFFNIGFSQENTKVEDGRFSYSEGAGLEVTIEFHERTIYYVNSDIIVQLQVANRSAEPFLFNTSFDKYFTFDFEIKEYSGDAVSHSRSYEVARSQFEPVKIDEITLKKNEVYGVRINLSDWFDLSKPGEYIVKGIFYPFLKTDSVSDPSIQSANELYLDLNPPYTERVREEHRVEEIRRLKAESLPPYEVVRVMLEALQRNDFEVYFLYIDFDQFIRQFANAEELYMEVSDREKRGVIEAIFKPYLRGENDLEKMPFIEHIPRTFEIVRTEIVGNESTVEVVEDFQYGNLQRRKYYKYYLHQFDDKWLLQKYEIVNPP